MNYKGNDLKTCQQPGCTKKVHCKDFCRNHYTNWQMKRYRAAHPERVKKWNLWAKLLQRKKRSDPVYRKNGVAKTREWRLKIRNEVFAAYGGDICACCGETEPLFLQLDHLEGNGCAHRRALGGRQSSSHIMYADIRKRGFPPGFQVLCGNCNMGRYRNGGICPHQKQIRKAS